MRAAAAKMSRSPRNINNNSNIIIIITNNNNNNNNINNITSNSNSCTMGSRESRRSTSTMIGPSTTAPQLPL